MGWDPGHSLCVCVCRVYTCIYIFIHSCVGARVMMSVETDTRTYECDTPCSPISSFPHSHMQHTYTRVLSVYMCVWMSQELRAERNLADDEPALLTEDDAERALVERLGEIRYDAPNFSASASPSFSPSTSISSSSVAPVAYVHAHICLYIRTLAPSQSSELSSCVHKWYRFRLTPILLRCALCMCSLHHHFLHAHTGISWASSGGLAMSHGGCRVGGSVGRTRESRTR